MSALETSAIGVLDAAARHSGRGVSIYQQELQHEYALRFTPLADYRQRVWQVLTASFFQQYIPADGTVLDLGCGWGEFINHIHSRTKYGMDLNPETFDRLNADVAFLCADCSSAWPLDDGALDVVFTSNFFEHLRTKEDLKNTLAQAYRCLKPGGRIICLGPNIRHTGGAYWDFWDHYLALTDVSLAEGLTMGGFRVTRSVPRFLPYTMVGKRQAPLWAVRLYLKLPILWRHFGHQFLLIAEKPLDT